jgi:hypothetical protein
VIPGGAWLFLGRNTELSLEKIKERGEAKRPKRNASIIGRAEHVEVDHGREL